MKTTLYRELLISMLIISIIPFSILGVQSASSLIEGAKKEMILETDSLAEKSNSIFSEIEEYAGLLAGQAEDIENNSEKYKDLYNESDYYVREGAYTTKPPEDIFEKSRVWIPETVPLDPEIKESIGLHTNLEPLYKAIMAHEENIAWVYGGYENGLFNIYPYNYPPKGYDVRNRPYYIKAKNEGRSIWSSPLLDAGGGGWMITCSTPLYDRSDNFIGVQCVDIALNSITKNIIGAKLYDTGYTFLIDEKGNLLASPDRAEQDLGISGVSYEEIILTEAQIKEAKTGNVTYAFSLLEHPNEGFASLVKRATEGKSFIEEIKFDDDKYVAFSPIESTGWSVGVAVPRREILAPVRNAMVWVAMIAIGAGISVSFFISRRISHPFRRLSDASSRIIGGDLSARVDTESSIKEFGDVAENVNKMVGSLQNTIDELVKREVEIKEAKIREETIINNALDLIILLNNEHRWLVVNPAWEEVTGFKPEELQGRVTEEQPCVTPGTLEALVPDRRSLAEGRVVPPFDVPLVCKDGREIVVSATERPLKDAEGRWIGSVWCGRDVTELRKREEEVRQARAYAEAIIANISDPLWVTDAEGKWILVNNAMERVTGYEKGELLEKQTLADPLFGPFITMFDGERKLRDMLDNIRAGDPVLPLSVLWLTKKGEMLFISCSGEPLLNAEGNVIGGVFIGKDVSTLQREGIAAAKVLNRRVEEEVGNNYELAALMFMSNAALMVGDSSLEILRGAVEGYNNRFGRDIQIEERIALKGVPEEDWPSFMEFLLSAFYECIGPATFECSEGIKSIEQIVEEVKARYGQ